MADILVYDTECYRDYWLLMFMNIATGNMRYFELHNDSKLDVETIRKILAHHTVVGFNVKNYDNPMISYALSGATNDRLKSASDAIIQGNIKPWVFESQFGIKILPFDHIDIFDVAPGMASLKIYGGRLHCRKMQDLPIDAGAMVRPDEREAVRAYCGNDLRTTRELFEYLKPQIDLRIRMSAEYKEDLRSKSDAQIAESVIISQARRMFAKEIYKPGSVPGSAIKYRGPEYLRFKSQGLKDLYNLILGTTFIIDKNGYVQLPDALGDYEIKLGSGIYRLGLGGIHSSEEGICHLSDDGYVCRDIDCTGYYPNIILNCNYYPRHIGPEFLVIYKDIINRRTRAKRDGDKTTAESLKITTNSAFGKLGSKWSKLYSPDLMIHVTLTGQLSLLLLIEMLEGAGISVVSANTDGVTMRFRRADEDKVREVTEQWQMATGYNLESTDYKSIFIKNVNNYIAIKQGGGHKTKGAYAPPGLQKNPQNEICTEAVVDFLEKGIPWQEAIMNCRDIRKFVTIRQVKGGGEKDGAYLGKAVRWYYAAGATGAITYKMNGNMVARSEGARPLMDLPDEFPPDVNYRWYLDEARSILQDIGYYGQWI